MWTTGLARKALEIYLTVCPTPRANHLWTSFQEPVAVLRVLVPVINRPIQDVKDGVKQPCQQGKIPDPRAERLEETSDTTQVTHAIREEGGNNTPDQ